MILSVIVPVYNVEKYIEKCILSIINNNLQIHEYEIIVIDDESPDNCVSIVQSMMKIHPQIKLISQKNKGLGGARNTGVLNASGEYVLFLDSDDYLKKNALKNVITFAVENKLDILEFGAIGVSENGDEVYRNSKFTDTINEGYIYLANIQYMHSACNKLYATQFLKCNQLQFVEQIFIEDFEFNTRAFYYAKRVQAIANILGCFVQTDNSITRNLDKNKNKKMVFDIKNVIYSTIIFSKEASKNKEVYSDVLDERIGFLSVTLFYTMLKLNIDSDIRKKIIDDLRKEKLFPIKVHINDSKKNAFKLIANNEFIYNLCCKIKSLI